MLKLQFWTESLDEFNAQPIWHRPACFASPGTGAVDTFSVDWHGESNWSSWTTVVHLPVVAYNLVTWLNVWCSVVLFARGYRNLLRWLGDVTRLGCVREVYY